MMQNEQIFNYRFVYYLQLLSQLVVLRGNRWGKFISLYLFAQKKKMLTCLILIAFIISFSLSIKLIKTHFFYLSFFCCCLICMKCFFGKWYLVMAVQQIKYRTIDTEGSRFRSIRNKINYRKSYRMVACRVLHEHS